MKKIALLLLLILAGMTAIGQRYTDSTWVIGNGHIGKVCINMDETKLTSLFDPQQIKADKKSAEGDEYSVIKITATGDTKTSLELETMCMDVCVISRIQCYSDKFKTVKGIGVGSTIGQLKAAHTISSVLGGENGIMVYIEDIPQTAFVVKVSGLKSVPGKKFEVQQIPDDTKIEWVYMY